MSERVLVTSAQERFALAACRSLAERGYEVSAVADAVPAATHWSRCCRNRYRLVDAKEDADRFVDGLGAILRRTRHAVTLPATDASLLALSARRERVEGLTLTGLPPHDVVLAATDKRQLDRAGREAELPTPETVVCRSAQDGHEAARELGFPVVIKPTTTAFELRGRIAYRNGVHVGDAGALETLAAEFGRPYLVQRALPGEVWSAAGVSGDAGVFGFVLARYLRTYPPLAGNVAFAETVDAPAGLRERIEALVANLGWKGIWELELVLGADGRFYAIDFNPRLYGSLALADRAGVPLAAMLCESLLGRPVPVRTAAAGVRYRWEEADLRHALHMLRERRVRAACAAVAPRRRVAHAYFRWSDPAPLGARVLQLGGAYLGSRTASRRDA